MYAAAKKFCIPRESLRRHIQHADTGKAGHPPVLLPNEEREIMETCKIFSDWGFGLTKVNIINVVADCLRHTKRPNPFKDGIPGEDWWKFMKRHSELTKRKPQSLQLLRAKAATPERVNHWFIECLKPTLDRLGLHDKLQCIYSVDKSGFPLSGRPAHVICNRGIKSPRSVIGGSGRENITV